MCEVGVSVGVAVLVCECFVFTLAFGSLYCHVFREPFSSLSPRTDPELNSG